jgi:hypothetical protein
MWGLGTPDTFLRTLANAETDCKGERPLRPPKGNSYSLFVIGYL